MNYQRESHSKIGRRKTYQSTLNTNQSLTDKVIPTKYRKGKEHYNDGGQITPVKGIGRWGGKDVPGMFKGGTK